MTQQQIHKQKTETKQEPAPEVQETEAKDQQPLTDAIEDILDEIDEVLEVNAEEFVRGFVQKGGE